MYTRTCVYIVYAHCRHTFHIHVYVCIAVNVSGFVPFHKYVHVCIAVNVSGFIPFHSLELLRRTVPMHWNWIRTTSRLSIGEAWQERSATVSIIFISIPFQFQFRFRICSVPPHSVEFLLLRLLRLQELGNYKDAIKDLRALVQFDPANAGERAVHVSLLGVEVVFPLNFNTFAVQYLKSVCVCVCVCVLKLALKSWRQ